MTEQLNNEIINGEEAVNSTPVVLSPESGAQMPVVCASQVLPSPENTVDHNDPGDDTTRRFRYQWTYAAILCLTLLKDNSEILYVYCEHHEDILLADREGRYCGVQVKTRLEGRDPFKTSEEAITKSLQRFVALEVKFGNQFRRYTLVTNSGFWTQDNTRDNLEHVRSLIDACNKNNTALCSNRTLNALVAALKEVEDCDDAVIESVFSKLELQKDMPALSDAHSRLIRHLGELDGFGAMMLDTVSNVAHQITDLVGRASSRECEPSYKDYAAVMRDTQGAADKAVIAGKRIDADAIRQIINDARNPASLLRLLGVRDVPQLDRGLNRLERKMDKGGLSLGNIRNAKDLQSVAESHGFEMLSIYGNEKGAERWNHVRTVVQNQCHEAHDDVEQEDAPYGKQMLNKVRERLKAVYDEQKSSLSGCRYEHLLGIASVLTQDCKVWWSAPFSLEGE